MEYRDNSKEKVITKKDLNGMVWRSLLLQASFNYERMQAGGWLYSIIPGLKKIHKNKEDLANSMKLHLEFFNVHPFLVTFVQGLVLAMEENKESQDSIRGIKIALMGPLGGIGDALFWFTLLPITASIGVSLAKDGNIAGPIIFLLLFNIVHIFLRFFLMHYSYKMGVGAIEKLKGDTEYVTNGSLILGLTVIGGLIASFVNLKISTIINLGNKVTVNIQQDVFDKIIPNILPLLYTLFMFYLLKKGKKPITLILITLVIGIAGRRFGIL
ncbi:PTS system mannose/fructose/sorbose family transporter subunit IID [Fusobacterium sp.]|uniref:PTS system mannose/fructose/sorbose family transporter subunit IID n=1 Tax=Fusobacterium sp. TaxID=68766 RepID=UPI002631A392|nr:PTS system mannose/fructose/sorbose family transporter subunit IID [Fusobacterium sp.]